MSLNTTKAKTAFANAQIASNTTTNGAILDLAGIEKPAIRVQFGTVTDGSYQIQIQESDDSGMAGASVITSASERIYGNAYNTAVATPASNSIYSFEFIKHKRYARLSIISTGVTTGARVSAMLTGENLQASLSGDTVNPS